MSTMWILVADAGRARIFENNNGRMLESRLLEEVEHSESRDKGVDLASDGPGHNQGRGNGSGAFVSTSDPKEYESERFAHQLAETLNQGRVKQQFDELLVVAPPRFHGLLNKTMNNHVKEMVRDYIDKDYTQMAEKELFTRLKDQVPVIPA